MERRPEKTRRTVYALASREPPRPRDGTGRGQRRAGVLQIVLLENCNLPLGGGIPAPKQTRRGSQILLQWVFSKAPRGVILRVSLLPALSECRMRDCTVLFRLQGSPAEARKGTAKINVSLFFKYVVAFRGASRAPRVGDLEKCEVFSSVSPQTHALCLLDGHTGWP